MVLSPFNDYSQRHAHPCRCSITIRLVVVEHCNHRPHYPTVFGRCVLGVIGLDTPIYPVSLRPASHPIEFATTPCTMASLPFRMITSTTSHLQDTTSHVTTSAFFPPPVPWPRSLLVPKIRSILCETAMVLHQPRAQYYDELCTTTCTIPNSSPTISSGTLRPLPLSKILDCPQSSIIHLRRNDAFPPSLA